MIEAVDAVPAALDALAVRDSVAIRCFRRCRLVSRVRSFSGRFGEDLVGDLGPAERFVALVVGVDEGGDRDDQISDAGEGGSTHDVTGGAAE